MIFVTCTPKQAEKMRIYASSFDEQVKFSEVKGRRKPPFVFNDADGRSYILKNTKDLTKIKGGAIGQYQIKDGRGVWII